MTIRSVSPIDGAVLGDFETSTKASIAKQVQIARASALDWAALDIRERCQRLSTLIPIIIEEVDNIVDVLVKTTGKVPTEALLGEIYPVLGLIRYYQKRAKRILKFQPVSTSPFSFPGSTAGIERRPYGVVAVSSPWNYPFQLTLAPLMTALFAGNAVIFKTSELSVPVGQLIVDLMARLELPQGLVHWVVGDGQSGAHMIEAGPDLVFFTGGLEVGHAVMELAARHPVPVILELGGKDPMLVFADANLQRTCDAALFGAFSNSGQICVSVERLYVERSCYQDFIRLLTNGVAQIKAGQDYGAMISGQQMAVVEEHYREALMLGAKSSGPLVRRGNYFDPVVLWDVTPDMKVMTDETFGPLLPVMPFTTDEEAIRLANQGNYGLNASIWTSDINRAKRVAAQLQVGNWAINDVIKNIGHSGLPFGGVKKSGFGRYHGAEGLLAFTYAVSGLICNSRLPREPNWFPYNNERFEHFKGFIDFVYGDGSCFTRLRRNWRALQTFRKYSTIDLTQRWQNLKLMLPWKRDY